MIGPPEFAVIFALLALVLAVIAAVYVLASSRQTERRLFWLAVVVLLPIGGPIWYFCTGRHPPAKPDSP